ncbi:RNA polymerase sigma factor [Lachnospiraceae bacterium MD1]|uniref:RNA polymerase sigma factor n=1 Tax=Variimorphobacter saccharofermentans TaxID=2755051 RepID=A0A839K3V3_9FIRM|nr:RNA polymerase sigma factor [Variimorphobacter saccharofermentans]MBB2183361.1 RNA polymerase sigma factor [Variimorphobacter saccharofermentans]
MEEVQLIQELKTGNKDAFDQLYDRYKDQALRTAVFLTGNRQDGEDTVQETFVKCYLHIQELHNEEGFKAWMYRILTRTAFSLCKRRRNEVSVEEIPEDLNNVLDNSPQKQLLDSERKHLIYEQIGKLDYKYRSVIILYYYNQLSIKEIARVLNCMEGTVKSRLSAARKKLEKSMKRMKEDWL